MNNKTQMTTAALFVAAASGFAAAGSLELDRSYGSELKADAGTRSVLNESNLSNIEIAVGVRFGYSYNSLDGSAVSDDDTTMGFQFRDVEVAIEGDVTDNMHARLSFQFGSSNANFVALNGAALLEDAYIDWDVNEDFSLRVGQFIPAFSAEASTSEFNTLSAYRSVSHEYLGTPSWTQGVEAHFGGDSWGFAIGFTDGPRAQNTAFDGAEFDYAVNARFDFFSDSDKARFDDQTSWRGSANGWRAGAGLFVAGVGRTNPSVATPTDWLAFTVDGAYEGDGWAVRAAFYATDVDTEGSVPHTNMGFEIGGSVFFSDQWEGFARWDMLLLDDDAGAGQTTGEDTFNFVSIGANYYFVPESHAAKFIIELGISLDETADIVNTTGDAFVPAFGGNSTTGFFQENAGEDGQIMISGTMQWLF